MHRLDEDDVRVRPSRGSRPRSALRPAHDDAVDAAVIAVDRGRYACLLPDGEQAVAVTARELGRRAVVVGDAVSVVGDLSGRPGALARIVRVAPRRSQLRRTADDADPTEQVIVANVDSLVVVASVADPEPRTGLVDRCLAAAYDAGIRPLLCVTKADLAPATTLVDAYRANGVEVVVGGRGDGGRGVAGLRAAIAGGWSVLVGHSGVGKSTLINALVPDADRATGRVNVVTGRGRHTSASAVALPLPGGGWVVDTPGVRSFGLGHLAVGRVVAAFPDLAQAAEDCPRGCDHRSGFCAMDAAVAAGRVPAQRVAWLRRLLAARDALEP